MRGTRYGDFSRSTFDPAKGYRSVLMQQGRVQVDADWNEQSDLQRALTVEGLADVLGASGAPARRPGYLVDPRVALRCGPGGAAVVGDAGPLAFGPGDEFTVEAAIRWDGGDGTLVDCLGAGEYDAGGYRLGVDSDGRLHFSRLCAGPDGEASMAADVAADHVIGAGRPVRVAAVGREGQVVLYVDARAVAEVAFPLAQPIVGGRVAIGAAVGGEGPAFPGLIAELRVWAGARSAAQLAAAARSDEEPGTRSGASGAGAGRSAIDPGGPRLVAHWPFDEGQGAVATDVVGGLTASLQGANPPGWQLVDLDIGAGRYYVDGIACQLDRPVRYTRQPGLPGRAVPGTPGVHLVYLEVWERTVSAVEDAGLLEEALGGLDTTVRSQTVAGVGHVPVPASVSADPAGADPDEVLGAALAATGASTSGTLAVRHQGEVLPGNYLYRVEVHRGGDTGRDPGGGTSVGASGRASGGAGLPDGILVTAVDLLAAELTLAEPWPLGLVEVDVEITAFEEQGGEVTSVHTIAAVVDETGHRIRLRSSPSALGDLAAPRLRPVRPSPSFKWSRRNGAEIFPIAPAHRGDSTVQLNGALSGVAPLGPGDVVELVTDPRSLGGPAAKLFRVAAIPGTDQVQLDRSVPAGVTAGHHPFLRRWSTGGTDDWGAPIEAGAWVELEDGIEVSFGPGAYREGDYWWIPARQQPDPLSWPTEHGHPAALGPAGVERRRAPLALLVLTDSDVRVVDLRGRIEPLVRPPGTAGPEPVAPPPEPVAGPAPVAPAPPVAPEPPFLPAGFAVVGPVGARPPGFRPMGLQVVTRPAWGPPRTLALPPHPLQGAALDGGTLLLATAEELWRLDADGLARLAPLPAPRQQFTLFAVPGTVLVVGGHPSGIRADGRVLAFDLAQGTWSERRPLPRPVGRPAVTALAGLVHVVGGLPPGASVGGSRDHQVYDPSADRWAVAPPLPEPMTPAAAGSVDGRVHVVGGATGKRLLGRREGAAHLALQPGQAQWVVEEPLPGGRSGVGTVTSTEGYLSVLAAPPHRPSAVVLMEYRATTGTWDPVAAPPRPLTGIILAAGPPGPRVVGVEAGEQVLYQLEGDGGWELFVPAADSAG